MLFQTGKLAGEMAGVEGQQIDTPQVVTKDTDQFEPEWGASAG